MVHRQPFKVSVTFGTEIYCNVSSEVTFPPHLGNWQLNPPNPSGQMHLCWKPCGIHDPPF